MRANEPCPPQPDRSAEFYIGWRPQAPRETARFLRLLLATLVLLAAAAGALWVRAQAPFADADFEYGQVRSFDGYLEAKPAPVLWLDGPRQAAGSRFALLVAPGKHGAGALVREHAGQLVRLRGSLIRRGAATMIEIEPGSIARLQSVSQARPGERRSPGIVELHGEIVDSKCFLGVMKPGEGKPHRDCATRCIAGGIPPLLLARGPGGEEAQILLTGPGGRAIQGEILPFVAEPVLVRGEIVARGGLLVLETDPRSIRRVAP